jgi:hypothetical protein
MCQGVLFSIQFQIFSVASNEHLEARSPAFTALRDTFMNTDRSPDLTAEPLKIGSRDIFLPALDLPLPTNWDPARMAERMLCQKCE